MVHDALAGYPVIFSIRAQWGEQDQFGHINNVYYLRWCESSRIEYLQRLGILNGANGSGIGPIVAHIACNYRRPVVYPDMLHVGAKVSKIGRTSFTMDHVLVSDRLGVVADATSVLVVYDYEGKRPHPVPDELREAIGKLEGEAQFRK